MPREESDAASRRFPPFLANARASMSRRGQDLRHAMSPLLQTGITPDASYIIKQNVAAFCGYPSCGGDAAAICQRGRYPYCPAFDTRYPRRIAPHHCWRACGIHRFAFCRSRPRALRIIRLAFLSLRRRNSGATPKSRNATLRRVSAT